MDFDLNINLSTVTETANAHLEDLQRIEAATLKTRADAEASLTDGIEDPAARDRILKSAAESIAKSAADTRAKLVKDRETLFASRRKILDEAAAKAEQVLNVARSPRAMLEVEALADTLKLNALLLVMRDATPALIMTYISLHLANPDDRALACALCRSLDAMDAKIRPVSPGRVAEAASGPRWRALTAAANQALYHHARAIAHEEATRTGRPVRPAQKVSLGIAARAAGLDPKAPLMEPAAVRRTALMKISAGLKARGKTE